MKLQNGKRTLVVNDERMQNILKEQGWKEKKPKKKPEEGGA